MHLVLRSLLMLTLTATMAHAAGSYDSESASTPSQFFATARGGFMLTPADAEVGSRWEHDTFYSYAFSLGLRYQFPMSSGLYFFSEGDLNYLMSEEQLSSNFSDSYLSTTMTELLFLIGAGWQIGPNWGVDLSIAYELWGEKETKFDSTNFNRSLGTEKTDVSFVYMIEGYYKFAPNMAGTLAYQGRTVSGGDIVLVGGRYGF